ncbi:DUF6745 domain-containing protein [Coleofasciculus sp. FACHB-T130]|uniref:DUF6745 domain-containing protein n=1 Tax=Cyanophyceae TaxID=3028117 RepID=UPI001F55A369|nr:hypothetical protein [Coleofasciculus sp. FACHB-T130]
MIPVYREKWRKIALSTEPIDRGKAAESVINAYDSIGKKAPKIIFSNSPYAALKTFSAKITKQPKKALNEQLRFQPWHQMEEQISNQIIEKHLNDQLWGGLERQLWGGLERQLFKQLIKQLGSKINHKYIPPEVWACGGSNFDFYISVLNCTYEQSKWSVFQSLVKNCGWILPSEEIAIICDRPRVLSFDNQQRLHAEGAPAIQFADGYSLYASHGVRLPEKYGKLHPHQWQAKWLLEDNNAELRRVLIQGIGYDKIAQELGAIELDSYQEYTLLKIDTDIDVEPISLLKMTCPSTGFIHALRVPPEMISAREAIAWVNWGINPKEFSVQT